MENRFADQVAIVAGGARGIGKGIAMRLAREGASVVALDVLWKELDNLLHESGAEDLKISSRVLDITEEKPVADTLREVMNTMGRIDILVNAAGIVGQTAVNITGYDTGVFDRVVDINLKGPFLLTKHVIPHMLKRGYGRIVHLASIGGKEGNPGMVGYAASKSGLLGLVKAVGKEYARDGITVNGIAPAVIATPMNADTEPEMLEYMKAKIPMNRLGTIEEVASLCCWIVSPEASFNTGCIFDISGGRATF